MTAEVILSGRLFINDSFRRSRRGKIESYSGVLPIIMWLSQLFRGLSFSPGHRPSLGFYCHRK